MFCSFINKDLKFVFKKIIFGVKSEIRGQIAASYQTDNDNFVWADVLSFPRLSSYGRPPRLCGLNRNDLV